MVHTMTWLVNDAQVRKYVDAVTAATTDNNSFVNFRQDGNIRQVIDIMEKTALDYKRMIPESFLSDNWDEISKGDMVGSPNRRIAIDKKRSLSTTTCRYAWNFYDMQQENLIHDDQHVVEIGGGFGGLCRMINSLSTPASYTIIDIPEVLKLARRYCEASGIDMSRVSTIPCTEVKEIRCDLLISNYAFTELDRIEQESYLKNIIDDATNGYITFNSNAAHKNKQYSLLELIARLEENHTHVVQRNEEIYKSKNVVITWTDVNASSICDTRTSLSFP